MMLKLLDATVLATLFVLGCSANTRPDIQTEERPAASNQLVDEPTDDSLDLHVTPEISEAQLLETRLVKMGAAFHEFHEKFGHFPPAASRDAEGNRLLSWRVHLLPFLGHYDLYREFHLNEPWDSPHNSSLIEKMPEEYLTGKPGPKTTSFVVFLGDECVFGGSKAEEWSRPLRPYVKEQQPSSQRMEISEEEAFAAPKKSQKEGGPRFGEMHDGTSNTILVVQAGDNVKIPWTRPEDVPFEPENPIAALGDIPDAGFLALYGDLRVRLISKKVTPAKLAAAITRAGGESDKP
jgi:hypothetical protein